jgi:hypothetical protein
MLPLFRIAHYTHTLQFETLSNDVPVVGTVGATGVYNLLNCDSPQDFGRSNQYANIQVGNFVGGDPSLKHKARRDVIGNGVEVTATVAGVKPHSPPNTIGYAIRSKVENGIPSISANYETSTIDHFDLYVPGVGPMIYYGCVSDPESDVALPVSCTITVKGYDRNNNLLASQDFLFKSEGGITQDMAPGYFSAAFVGLYRVEFSTNSPLSLFGTTLDNIWTRVYQKK